MKGVFLGAMLLSAMCSAHGQTPLQFSFRGEDAITLAAGYASTTGFGFEPGSTPNDARFSVKLDEGNYRVTVRIGDPHAAVTTTVSAEARRLMLEQIPVARGEWVTRSFVVNIRTPALPAPPLNAPGGDAVRVNPAESMTATWDDRLTLEFTGTAQGVAALTIERADVPTLYLAGDSTVTDVATGPDASWGQMLPRFFDSGIAIANHAHSGETLKSFLASLRLDKILSRIQHGDWLLIQFGHNDQKSQWPQTYAAADSTYREYLRVYIAEARRRGAIPILVTSPERRNFDESGHIVDSHGDYPQAVRDVAREERVALIDLWTMSKTFYESLGPKLATAAFADGGRDRTHHSRYGAYELARMVVNGVRDADPALIGPLARHLAADAGRFDPRHPDDPGRF